MMVFGSQFKLDQAARAAGFRTADQIQTCSDTHEALGFDVVDSELLPAGWFGMQTQRGAVLIGPQGQLIDVPFFPKDWPTPSSRSGLIP